MHTTKNTSIFIEYPMRVNLYYHQHRNLPLDTCVVDRATVAKLSTQQPAWFAIRCSGKIVVLRIKGDEQIEAGDAVVNPWVVETFNMSKGTAVNVEMVEVSTLGQRTEVELSFVAHYSLKHWDEVAYGGALSLPHIWTPVWQRTGKVALVENHCKLALFGSALCDGALIVIQTLDSLLAFTVVLPTYSNVSSGSLHAILGNENCEYHITFPKEVEEKENQQQDSSLLATELCFLPAISTIQCICSGVFPENGSGARINGLTKSMLLSAPQGGGKSHLLDVIVHLCCSQPWSRNVEVIKLSCMSLVNRKMTQIEELQPTETGQRASPEMRLRNSLEVILRMLGCSVDVCERIFHSNGTYRGLNNASMNSGPGLLLLLDDMDSVFSNYSSSKDDNIPYTTDGDIYKQLGYHLSVLLDELSSVDCAAPVVVVAATRRASTQLLRAHTGCPEFEKCIELCSPTFSERVIVLNSLLVLSNLLLQPLARTQPAQDGVAGGDAPTCNNTDSLNLSAASANSEVNMKIWAERLAGLTAGYLPGDLCAVVQRLGLLHRGKLAAMMQQNAFNRHSTDVEDDREDSSLPATQHTEAVAWSCALEAVVAVVPLQLHGLSAQSGRQGTATGRLSWQDFAGYAELVADLKRRLIPRTISLHTAVTSSQAPPTIAVTATAADSSTSTTATDEKNSRNGFGVRTLKTSLLRGLVLYGPTGCGKTLLASVITSELKMNFVSVRSTDLLSKYFGETENTIRNLFRKARSAAPCVLFFDDFDSLAHKRSAGDADSSSTSNGLHGRILSTFLNELDGIMSSGSSSGSSSGGKAATAENQILVIAACQNLTNLDEALIRPGRLQHHVFLHEPRPQDIHAILHRYLHKLHCAPDLDTTPAVQALSTACASASEVECFVRNAFMHALREKVHAIEGKRSHTETESVSAAGTGKKSAAVSLGVGGTAERGVILQKHINQALKDLAPTDTLQVQERSVGIINSSSSSSSAGFSWSGEFSIGNN